MLGLLRWAAIATMLTSVVNGFPTNMRRWVGPGPRKSPLDFDITTKGPNYDIRKWQVLDGPSPVNSHWVVHYITTKSNRDLVVLSHWSTNSGSHGCGASIYDIEAGAYQAYELADVPAVSSADSLDIKFDDYYGWAADTPDQFSSITSWSDRDGLVYNLTFQPNGPNLYDGGSGSYFWTTDFTNEWAAPNSIVSGTVIINGRVHEVDPHRSSAWYDRQWGPGRPSNGWDWFPIRLHSGLSLAIWATNPVKGRSEAFGTLLYANGTSEVFSISSELQRSDPWVSKQSNLTYYGSIRVDIPGRGYIIATMPDAQRIQYGELWTGTAATSVSESYAVYSGVWDGNRVKGWGLVEQKLDF